MDGNIRTSVLSHSPGIDAGIILFTLLLLAYGTYILWAVSRRTDEIDRQIREALDYTRRQEATARAIKDGDR